MDVGAVTVALMQLQFGEAFLGIRPFLFIELFENGWTHQELTFFGHVNP